MLKMYSNQLYKFLVLLLIASCDECSKYKVTDRIYFDVQVEDKFLGRIVFGLFGEVAPITCENFKEIAIHGINGKSYLGTKFHSAIQKVMIQGEVSILGDAYRYTIFHEYMPKQSRPLKTKQRLCRSAEPSYIKTLGHVNKIVERGIVRDEIHPKYIISLGAVTATSKILNGNIWQVIPQLKGGDIVNNDGTGSISIYGKYFDDENFTIKNNAPGLLVMANEGPNTNGCQFMITTMPMPWLDGKNVIFGKVLDGAGVVHKIEHMKTDVNEKIIRNVWVSGVGSIDTIPFYERSKSYELTIWAWLRAGIFPLSISLFVMACFQYIFIQLNKAETSPE